MALLLSPHFFRFFSVGLLDLGRSSTWNMSGNRGIRIYVFPAKSRRRFRVLDRRNGVGKGGSEPSLPVTLLVGKCPLSGVPVRHSDITGLMFLCFREALRPALEHNVLIGQTKTENSRACTRDEESTPTLDDSFGCVPDRATHERVSDVAPAQDCG